MTTLVAIQNNLGHYISFRSFLVLVYDILGDLWSSFLTTLVVIQNNVVHCISFGTLLVVVYNILGEFWCSFMTFWEIFGARL